MGVLALVIIATGISRLDQASDASRALVWWPYNSDAAIALAEKRLDAKTADGRLEADRLARGVLRTDPMNYKAMRILGLLAAQQQQLDAADAFMEAATRRSNRDTPAQLWIFHRALARGDFVSAFRAADAVLRRRPQQRTTLFPPMFAILDYASEARTAVAERLAWLPAWRQSFLQAYAGHAPSPDQVEALFEAIDGTAAPVADQEFSPYLERLIKAKDYQRAHSAWSERLASDQPVDGAIYDGGFDQRDALPPFGWTIRRGAGVIAERTQAPQRDTRALNVEFSGSGKALSVAEQLLILPPGDYVFSGISLFFTAREPERIVWSLDCDGGQQLLEAREATPAIGTWKAFQTSFSVPTDCAAQRLRLRVVPGDTLAPISVWYDDLRIVLATESRNSL